MRFKNRELVKVIGNSDHNPYGDHSFPIGTTCEILKGIGLETTPQFYRVKCGMKEQTIFTKDLISVSKTPPVRDFWRELKTDLKDKYGFAEKDIEEAIELLKLKKAIADLTTKDLAELEA